MSDPDVAAEAASLDAADPLAAYRDLFVGTEPGAESVAAYFDGNSLGRPLRATADRLAEFTASPWGTRLIRSWDEQWMVLPYRLGDELGAALLGAAPGQTIVADSTTVLLYKLIRAAFDAQQRRDPRRVEIVVDHDNFPTDRFVVEGIAAERGGRVRWIEGVDSAAGVDEAALRGVLSPETALVVLSHVAYRSGYLADGAALTAAAHEHGALILWDLCHSAGSVPVHLDAWGADLAVGCTYKYLNGGPGSPAFAYVAARHQAALTQPIQGWMGAADVFAMGPEYAPGDGMRRFLSGTPPILAMVPLQVSVEVIADAGIDAIRAKSVALTRFALRIADAWPASLGVSVASPRDDDRRGGHITLQHPAMRDVTAALWAQDIIPDYRDPDGLRIGLSPLSTSFAEVARGMDAVRSAVAAR